MDELRFVRRDERSLILANENDEEFRLVIDDLLLAELKHASRKEREGNPVRPREIQSLVRGGKTRLEIAALTGLDESDIERYEEPVLAERRYILERAHAVPVRTDVIDAVDQRFGEVISERLIGLDADASEWAAWKDEETGWMVSLEFISRDVAHRAVWSFDHRKQTLAPTNSDATSLSKQGDVGDRLIPKLRAVDNGERNSQFVPVEEPAAAETPAQGEAPTTEAQSTPVAEQVETPPADPYAEYARRREIDQRAIKSEDTGPADFSQTADLLDALRRRRGERKLAQDATKAEGNDAAQPGAPQATPADSAQQAPAQADPEPVQIPIAPVPPAPAAPVVVAPPAPQPNDVAPLRGLKKSRSIWGNAGVSSNASPAAPRNPDPAPAPPVQPVTPASEIPKVGPPPAAPQQPTEGAVTPQGAPRKGRASIPSWDDILFGTRSDEDPAT